MRILNKDAAGGDAWGLNIKKKKKRSREAWRGAGGHTSVTEEYALVRKELGFKERVLEGEGT